MPARAALDSVSVPAHFKNDRCRVWPTIQQRQDALVLRGLSSSAILLHVIHKCTSTKPVCCRLLRGAAPLPHPSPAAAATPYMGGLALGVGSARGVAQLESATGRAGGAL